MPRQPTPPPRELLRTAADLFAAFRDLGAAHQQNNPSLIEVRRAEVMLQAASLTSRAPDHCRNCGRYTWLNDQYACSSVCTNSLAISAQQAKPSPTRPPSPLSP